VLLATGVVVGRPGGLRFAIAGSIVTTVGLILRYQQSTDRWESWAYAWALIPVASGLATLVCGLVYRRRDLVDDGIRVVAIAAVLFAAGYWFFETIFQSGRAPIDAAAWWPLIVVGLGVYVTARASLRSARSTTSTGDSASSGGTTA
jgi:hypothetical protein